MDRSKEAEVQDLENCVALSEAKQQAPRSSIYTQRAISHDEAQESVQRLINSAFRNNGEKARFSIPANIDRDDDLVMSAYIEQQRAAAKPIEETTSAVLDDSATQFSKSSPPQQQPGEGENVKEPRTEIKELIERLKSQADSTSRASKMIADAKSARNQAAEGGEWPDYEWLRPEQTLEWKAAREIENLRAELQAKDREIAGLRHLCDEAADLIKKQHERLESNADAAMAARIDAWNEGREAAAKECDERCGNVVAARIRLLHNPYAQMAAWAALSSKAEQAKL